MKYRTLKMSFLYGNYVCKLIEAGELYVPGCQRMHRIGFLSLKAGEKSVDHDGTRKCHLEQGNPITKEHAWYALTDEWMLAPKVRINKIQLTDHRKLKELKWEDQSVGALVFLTKGTKYSQEH